MQVQIFIVSQWMSSSTVQRARTPRAFSRPCSLRRQGQGSLRRQGQVSLQRQGQGSLRCMHPNLPSERGNGFSEATAASEKFLCRIRVA